MALTRNTALKILGLTDAASLEDIKKAYRKLRGKAHPDQGGTEDEFRKIQEAYDFLEKLGGSPARDAMEDIFGVRPGRDQRPARVKFTSLIPVTMREAFFGGKRQVQFDAIGPQIFTIDIPQGITPQSCLRTIVAKDKHGTEITINVHAQIEQGEYKVTWATMPELYSGGVEGSGDMEKPIRVNWLTIMQGGKYLYETIDGKTLELRIAPGTESGTRLKIKGSGYWKDLHQSSRGDVYLRIVPDLPRLDEVEAADLEEAIKAFKNALTKKRDPFWQLEKDKIAKQEKDAREKAKAEKYCL